MHDLNLTANETRVIGCLLEKSLVTPDQYPLTLNALTNACNQKSSRSPVMTLTQGVVQHTVRELEAKSLVSYEENFKRGVEKYKHRFCNTHFSDLQLDPAEYAIVCVLLLRGPQTPGELRTHCARLHDFSDNHAVTEALTGLIERDGGALLVQLPRTAGRKDSEYMHLFSGPIDIEEYASHAKESAGSESSSRVTVSELTERVIALEEEVTKLKALLETSE